MTLIVPIMVATAIAGFMFQRLGLEETRDRQRDRVNAAAALIAAASDQLATESQILLADDPTRVNDLLSADLGQVQTTLEMVRSRTGSVLAASLDTGGAIVTEAVVGEQTAGCRVTVRVPLKVEGRTQRELLISRRLNRLQINSMARLVGDEMALVCEGAVAANTFSDQEQSEAALLALTAPPPGGTDASELRVDGTKYLTYTYTIQPDPMAPPIEIITGQTEEQVSGRVTAVVQSGLVLVAFSLAVAVLLGFLATRTIINPLKTLTAAALKAEEGDMEAAVDIRSHDEVGVLAKGFIDMRSRIRDYIGEMQESRDRTLRAVSAASNTLGSSYDRDRLINVVTEAVAVLTRADYAAFYLFELGEGKIMHRPAGKLPPDEWPPEVNTVITGVLDTVSKGVSPEIVSEITRGIHVIAAPVSVRERPIGALVSASSKTGEMEEPVHEVLQSLSAHFSIALENIELQQELMERAITDHLTGLRNLRYFRGRLDEEIEEARRYDSHLGLIMLDLDLFKAVNDTYGHLVGDEVLRQVGHLLHENVRKSDVAARYGGEEFALILPQTNKEMAFSVAEKIRAEAQGLRIPGFGQIRISLSAGVASFPTDAAEMEGLIRAADEATYRAKRLGRNRVESA